MLEVSLLGVLTVVRLERDAWSTAKWLKTKQQMSTLHLPPQKLPRYIYSVHVIGWLGVGWQRRCKIRQSLRELDHQGTVFFCILFLAVAMAGGRGRSFVRAGEP